MRRFLIISALVVCFTIPLESLLNAEQGLRLKGITLADFIDVVARYTSTNIVYTPSEAQGIVSVRIKMEFDKSDLVLILKKILDINNKEMVDHDGVLYVVNKQAPIVEAPPKPEHELKIYKLRYANAQTVAIALAKTFAGKDHPLRIVSDEAANTIIIFGNTDNFESIAETIDKLDVRKKQVFIDALVIEVPYKKSDSFGIDWHKKGDNDNISVTDIGNHVTYKGVPFPNLKTLAVKLYSDKEIDILSRPQILALDNKETEIFIGENRPYSLSSTINKPTDRFKSNSQTFDYRDLGLRLRLVPHIQDDGNIVLDIKSEYKKFVRNGMKDTLTPITITRRSSSIVSLPNDTTIMLSGLIKDENVQTDTDSDGDSKKRDLLIFLRTASAEDMTQLKEYTVEKPVVMPEPKKAAFMGEAGAKIGQINFAGLELSGYADLGIRFPSDIGLSIGAEYGLAYGSVTLNQKTYNFSFNPLEVNLKLRYFFTDDISAYIGGGWSSNIFTQPLYSVSNGFQYFAGVKLYFVGIEVKSRFLDNNLFIIQTSAGVTIGF